LALLTIYFIYQILFQKNIKIENYNYKESKKPSRFLKREKGAKSFNENILYYIN
jgi:hypothetical protein